MSSYYHAKKREAEPAAREIRDAMLEEKIMEVWKGRKGREVVNLRKSCDVTVGVNGACGRDTLAWGV